MLWEVHPDGPQWSLRRTTAGRVLAGLGWAWKGFVGAVLLGTVFFGIDWVGRTTTGVPVPRGFLVTVVSFAALVGFGAFVARLLRFRHWIIDRDARTLALSLRRVFDDPQVHEVSFDELQRVVIRSASFGTKASIEAVFEDGTIETLATTRLGQSAVEPLVVGLRRAFDDTGVRVDVES